MEKILLTVSSILFGVFFAVSDTRTQEPNSIDQAREIRKSDPERALEILKQELENDGLSDSDRGEVYYLQGLINYWELSDKEIALSRFYDALRYFRVEEMQDREYNSLVYVALCYKNLFHYEYAEEYYLEILKTEGLDSSRIMRTEYNLGMIYMLQKKFNLAKQTFENVIEYHENSGDQKRLVLAKAALADNYAKDKQYEKSEALYREVQQLVEENEDYAGLRSKSINSLGYIKLQLGEYQEAEKYLLHGLELKKGSSDRQSLLMSYLNLGELYQVLNNPEKAIEFYELGSQLNEKAVNHLNLIEALNGLLAIAKTKKDISSVVRHQDRIIEIQGPYVELSERLEILHSKYKAERVKYLNEKIELQAKLILSQNRNLIGALIFTGCLVLAFVGLYWQYRKLKIDHDLIGWLRKQSKLLFFLQRKYNIDLEQAEKELDRGAY